SQVVDFLGTSGSSLTDELIRAREAASAGLDFERAAAQHRRIEKVDALRKAMPDFARRLEMLDALILQRGANQKSVVAFQVRGGQIADPFLLRFDELASQPRSAEDLLRGALQSDQATEQPIGEKPREDPGSNSLDSNANRRAEMEDHLALLSRWYY